MIPCIADVLRPGRRLARLGFAGLVSLFLAMLLTACGGLMDEPRIVATLSPTDEFVIVRTDSDPLLAQGAQLFAERCASCHGEFGRGDGPVIRAAQIGAPPDFTQPSTMSMQGVQAIYDVVTAGRIELMMPPWEGVLTAAERQAVAAYVAALGGEAPAAYSNQSQAE